MAVLLQCDLEVIGNEKEEMVELASDTERVHLPIPSLAAWRTQRPAIVRWRGIELPQVERKDQEYPDILGLTYYLFNDLEEIQQEAFSPEERYDITRSNLGNVYRSNYLDRLLSELRKDLSVSIVPNPGVILTHDLDFLSLKGFHLHRSFTGIAAPKKWQEWKKNLRFVKARYEKLKKRFHRFEEFEFLDWVNAEREHGYKSVFFVFADRRKSGFEGDAWYHLGYRDRKAPLATLGRTLRALHQEGFSVGLHLSRSSNYTWDQIVAEFESLAKSMGHRIDCTRNHWYWVRFSNWHTYLHRLGVLFDFNVAAQGFAKGTAFPYLAKNGSTVVFPTTYMDDAVFKSKNLHLGREEAIELLNGQIDTLVQNGGCIAISFHPAEDGPLGTLKIDHKLSFYKEILEVLSKKRIGVYLPEEARKKFFGYEVQWRF